MSLTAHRMLVCYRQRCVVSAANRGNPSSPSNFRTPQSQAPYSSPAAAASMNNGKDDTRKSAHFNDQYSTPTTFKPGYWLHTYHLTFVVKSSKVKDHCSTRRRYTHLPLDVEFPVVCMTFFAATCMPMQRWLAALVA